MADKFWGNVFEFATGFVTGTLMFPVVIVNGVVESVKGNDFEDGFAEVYEAVEEAAEAAGDFGDRHSSKISRVAIGMAAAAVTGAVVDSGGFDFTPGGGDGAVDATAAGVHGDQHGTDVKFGYEGPSGQDPNLSTSDSKPVYQDTSGHYHPQNDPTQEIPKSLLKGTPPAA